MKKLIFPILFILFLTAALFTGDRFAKHSEAKQAEDVSRPADEKKPSDLSLSIQEILNTVCEHKLPAYQCGECRYEVGSVKVEKDLLHNEENPGKGLVRVIPATKKRVNLSFNATGEINLNENMAADIRPRIEGIIRSVNVDIGARVKKNDVLLTIESTDLGQVLSEYLKYRSLVELYAKTFSREKSLYEQKISAEQDVLEAQANLKQAQADLQASKQRLQVLGLTEKAIATIKPDDHGSLPGLLTIRAPLDGTIIEKHAVVGELVEPNTDVMVLANLDTVWVWADIYESDFSRLLKKMNDGPIPVEIRQLAFPEEVFRGHIDYVGDTMDEQTRTVKVRATMTNEKKLLRPGVFCEVTILLSSDEEVLAVPKSALLSDEGVHFIYKHLQDDYYVRRPVKKGREFAESIEILEGIEPGELIVSDGAFLLKSDTLRSKMGAGCAD